MLKTALGLVLVLVAFQIQSMNFAFAANSGGGTQAQFPRSPDQSLTPGSLCTRASEIRYPARIKYCDRNVDSSLKRVVIAKYDSVLGYRIRQMNRQDFKIDHFIPLSIGGSNEATNLWPQHKSVYAYSDPLESEVSNLIIDAKITQAEAIRVIKECKLNLGQCSQLYNYLKGLR